jgi:hypothetical protein
VSSVLFFSSIKRSFRLSSSLPHAVFVPSTHISVSLTAISKDFIGERDDGGESIWIEGDVREGGAGDLATVTGVGCVEGDGVGGELGSVEIG